MLYEFYSETVYSSCKPLVGFFEIRSHYVAHVGFKFPGSTDPPALASLAPRTTGANYSAQLTRKKALFNLLLFCVHTMFTGCVHRPAMVHRGLKTALWSQFSLHLCVDSRENSGRWLTEQHFYLLDHLA